MNSQQILDREYLEIRSRILDIAASLDRIQRADGNVDSDDRMKLIAKALEIVSGSDQHRAEKIQLLFSRDYDNSWKEDFFAASKA
jgi:hypothetical protein